MFMEWGGECCKRLDLWFWCHIVITVTGNKQHQTRCGQVPLSLLLHLRGHHGLQGQISPLYIFCICTNYLYKCKVENLKTFWTHILKKSFWLSYLQIICKSDEIKTV